MERSGKSASEVGDPGEVGMVRSGAGGTGSLLLGEKLPLSQLCLWPNLCGGYGHRAKDSPESEDVEELGTGESRAPQNESPGR